MSVKFPFFGGGFGGGGGECGECRFYFYGRADFSEKCHFRCCLASCFGICVADTTLRRGIVSTFRVATAAKAMAPLIPAAAPVVYKSTGVEARTLCVISLKNEPSHYKNNKAGFWGALSCLKVPWQKVFLLSYYRG